MYVLIVGDDDTGNHLVKAILDVENHENVIAINGQEALDLLEKQEFDMVVSDINMPVMNGFDLLYNIRRSKNHKYTPVIFYTATSTSQSSEQLAFSLGVDIYLRKTGSIKAINEAIRLIEEKFGSKGNVEL
jgi:DNA-binding response OmpR family regulator